MRTGWKRSPKGVIAIIITIIAIERRPPHDPQLLFWLSGVPFVTNWMGDSRFAVGPVPGPECLPQERIRPCGRGSRRGGSVASPRLGSSRRRQSERKRPGSSRLRV